MRQVELSEVEGIRWLPDDPSGVGALVLAGSSGRVDSARAELLARHGVVGESIRWFGGHGQHDGPWEIPLELFFERVDRLAAECDRVLVFGTSFGAEAALLTGALHPGVDAVVAFAPSDVVWAGVRTDGSVTSHWTLGGTPLPFVPLDDTWEAESEVPAFVGCYRASRRRFADRLAEAAIPVERIRQLVLVAGADDQVWPAVDMSRAIEERRTVHGLGTVVVSDPEAGHRAVLPGEPVVRGGIRMRRGGSDMADRRLGESAWAQITTLL
jgi:pimeloyl-ACP methyl ester carboxylesterase